MARTRGRITSSKVLLLSSSYSIFEEQGGHTWLLHRATFAINGCKGSCKSNWAMYPGIQLGTVGNASDEFNNVMEV